MGHAERKRERLELVEALLQLAPAEGYTKKDLAARFGCDPATIHRDLDEIGRSGALIQVSRGHYRLDPAQSLSNVRLHPSEALSIYLALRRFIRQTSHAPDFMLMALQKIVPAIRRRDLIQSLGESILELEEHQLSSPAHTQIWDTLLRGWLEQLVVRIEYLKPREQGTSVHEIEPLLFEPAILSQGTYVIAWSRTRDELRTFKIDRIQRASLSIQKFEPRAELNINVLLRHAWGVWYGEETERVELLFVPEVAGRVMETVWHPREEKTVLEDGSILWAVDIAGTREILSWIRGWAHEVRVLGPESLRQQVAADLRAAAAQYEG